MSERRNHPELPGPTDSKGDKQQDMRKTTVYLASAISLFAGGCSAGSKVEGPIRPPAVAGRFYSGSADELRLAVERFLGEAVSARVADPVALVVPHAGYIYCGQIIADAFKQTAGHEYDIVVLLGTNHTTPDFRGVSVFAKGAFETPLGTSPVDEEIAAKILSADRMFVNEPRVHQREHSVEVQLPFVQVLFPKAHIVPMVIGEPQMEMCERLGKALAEALAGKRALIVASSDLSHYPEYDDACEVDRGTLEAIASLDPHAVKNVTREARGRYAQLSTCACGEGPILAAISAARAMGAEGGIVVSYANSGDVAVGDMDRVVGYGAVVFAKGIPRSAPQVESTCDASRDSEAALSVRDKQELLTLARKTIEWYLTSETLPLPRGFSPAANRLEGAFVTLRRHGQLRGCIGHMSEDLPLCRVVEMMAISAATEDRRFRPVTPDELSDIKIEISRLTPMKPVPDASHIVPGRDGVVLRKGGKSAVFLPQVATEQGWSREELLDNLCLKAGLPAGAWREEAQLLTFQADVFAEGDL